MYQLRSLLSSLSFAVVIIFCASISDVLSQTNFGRVELPPDFEVNGAGQDVDTITFWETPDPTQTLMFVTAKASQLVEVWQYPFVDNEMQPLRHSSFGSGTRVNGVVFDQERDELYVVTSAPVSTVSVFSYPGGEFKREIIKGDHDLRSEPNIDIYFRSNGERRIYVTADNIVYVYNGETGQELFDFEPSTSIETVIADEYYQRLYIPDEKTRKGVFVFNPDGTPYSQDGKQVFGGGDIFQSDEEGILLYTFPSNGTSDNGAGFIVISDQKSDQTDFEFFDRQTWEHLGTLNVEGVSNTDGIASTQRTLPDYPLGLFACINDDGTTVGLGWHTIFAATGLSDGGGDGAATGSVSGQVFDDATNQPLEAAIVQLRQSGQVRFEASSSATGFYEVKNVSAGNYDLVCSKSGFESLTMSISLEEGQDLPGQDFFLISNTDLIPPSPPANVRVTIDQKNN